MRANDGELKAQLMKTAEDVIQRLLSGAKAKEELTLSDIERLVRQAGEDMMQDMTGVMANAEAQGQEERICPECGGKMRYKGQKKRAVVSETGEVSLMRGYYYCPSCQEGFFPPRPALGLERDGV